MTRVLVLGMSHVRSLANAVAANPGHSAFEIVNLRMAPDIYDPESRDLRLEGRSWQSPDVVCLALEGNLHNVFTLLKTPERFRLGDVDAGSVPAAPGPGHPAFPPAGWFVPRDMLHALFKRRLRRLDIWTAAIHAHFPAARFLHICAPPPILALPVLPAPADRGADQNVMMYFMGFDAAPPLLRRKVFDLQTEIYADVAARHGAVFLPPPDAACTPDGFLEPAFWGNDPTHGNTAYGRLVIDQIRTAAGLLHKAAAQVSG